MPLLGNPDVAGDFRHGKNQTIAAFGGSKISSAAELQPARLRTVNELRLANGALCRGIQALSPDGIRAVRGGQEVEPVAVRRPPGAAVHSRAVHNGNPLRLRSSLTLVRGRNEESPGSVAARS